MNHLDGICDDKAFLWRQPSVHAVVWELEQKAKHKIEMSEKKEWNAEDSN